MTQNYYRNEYTNDQWRALVDKALSYGCEISYSIYGNIATIDSTATETLALTRAGRGEHDRMAWADFIHGSIQKFAVAH